MVDLRRMLAINARNGIRRCSARRNSCNGGGGAVTPLASCRSRSSIAIRSLESYNHALFRTIVETLEAERPRGRGDRPLSRGLPAGDDGARTAHLHGQCPTTRAPCADYAETLKRSSGIILCFPHWWFSMPAMLKGWVDRVWGPGMAFTYDPGTTTSRPPRATSGCSAWSRRYGSPWWIVRLFAGDAGRKVLMRGMKPMCARGVRSFYLAHYDMDHSTARSRQAFLDKVRRTVAGIRLDRKESRTFPQPAGPTRRLSVEGGSSCARIALMSLGILAVALRRLRARTIQIASRGAGDYEVVALVAD